MDRLLNKSSIAAPVSLFPQDVWARLDRAATLLPSRWAPWLSAGGLLQDRIRAETGEPARVHVIEERIGFLTQEQREMLKAQADSCFHRRIELRAAGRAFVYAETLVPDHTLEAHPWLADLGERGLGETLSWRHDVERGPLEVASLPPDHPLAARALDSAGLTSQALWARRAWYAIDGNRILVQEVFLPEPRRR